MTLDAQLIVPGISVFLQSPYLPNLWLLSSELCLIMKVGLCISQQMKQALVRWRLGAGWVSSKRVMKPIRLCFFNQFCLLLFSCVCVVKRLD